MNSAQRQTLADRLRWVLNRRRRHARYYDYPDKRAKELHVVATLSSCLRKDGREHFRELRPLEQGDDPPDCAGEDSLGRLVAFEVTELVDEDAARRAAAGPLLTSPSWSLERLVDGLFRILEKKDLAIGRPYLQQVLVVHCAEPDVLAPRLFRHLEQVEFPRPRHIDRAFLLMSYLARERTTPYTELKWREPSNQAARAD